ncbi:MAG TPA: hypothetical protein VIG54_07240 [Lysobacter sp.]
MRIVEFVVAVVALIALFGWLVGRPHTLESLQRQDTPDDITHVDPRQGADRDVGAHDDAGANDD